MTSEQAPAFTMVGDAAAACEGDACLVPQHRHDDAGPAGRHDAGPAGRRDREPDDAGPAGRHDPAPAGRHDPEPDDPAPAGRHDAG